MAHPLDPIHDRELRARRESIVYFAILAIAMAAVIGVFLLALIR
jgi:hypothetical protein